MASDIAGGVHRFSDCVGIQVRRAGAGFMTTKINTDAETVILLMLDGFDCSHARGNRQALRYRQAGFNLGCALVLCHFERFGDDVFERFRVRKC